MTTCVEARTRTIGRDLLNAGTGILAGAALMYFFDPDRGRARRVMVRDKTNHYCHESLDAVERTVHDLQNRVSGLAHETEALLHDEGPIDDDKLLARIRAKLGHLVSHPHNVKAEVDDGRVTLTGPVGPGEVDALMLAVRAMPGVKVIENKMDVIAHQDEVKRALPRFVGQLATLAGVSALALAKFR